MFDFLVEKTIVRHLLMLGGITVVMSQSAAWHPWIAGLSTFLVLMILLAVVALHGDPRAAALLAGAAALLGTAVCWREGANLSVSLAVIVSMIGTMSLVALSVIVCVISRYRLRKIAELEAQQLKLARKVYDYDRNTCLSGEIPVFGLNPPPDPTRQADKNVDPAFGQMLSEMVYTPRSSVLDPEVFNFAILLLSMQQIGHRLSSQLELDSLVSAILETAKETLRCQHAELHLWNMRESRLTNAVPSETPLLDSPQAVLAQTTPTPAVFEWVRQQRRILARREFLAGKVEAPELADQTLPTAVAPLFVGDDLVGVLIVNDAEDEGPTFLRMLYILANHCALSLKNAQLFRHIAEMARRDSLTGLLNHASFLEELERLIDEAPAKGQPLTLVMSDLDHFKDFNNDYGHQAGDRVLQAVADWWRAIMPDHAVLGRYGGEEFIGALPGETLDRGTELAEMLRLALESHPVSYHGFQLHVTASFGVTELGCPATTATRLIRLADKALYRAKDEGRNCVEPHDPLRPDIADMPESAHFTLK